MIAEKINLNSVLPYQTKKNLITGIQQLNCCYFGVSREQKENSHKYGAIHYRNFQHNETYFYCTRIQNLSSNKVQISENGIENPKQNKQKNTTECTIEQWNRIFCWLLFMISNKVVLNRKNNGIICIKLLAKAE